MAVDYGKLFDAVGKLSQVAGATAGGPGTGRLADFNAQNSAVNTELQRQRMARALPSFGASQGLISDVLSNAGRLSLNRQTGHAEGGLSPALIGENTKASIPAL